MDKFNVENLDLYYGQFKALKDVTIKIPDHEITAFIGPSGCGKSTILRTLGGFLDIDKGDVLIDGQSVKNLPPEKRPTAMVFQSYNLWPHMTVYENLAFGLEIKKVPKNKIRSEIERGLKLVNMSGYEKKYPGQLSGGQQQRVLLARALVNEPKLLILDEPTAGQDYRHYTEIMEFLKHLNETLGITIIMITHDMHLMLEYTDRAIVIADGELIADDKPAKVLTDEAVADRAYLKKTSLYDLAVRCGIGDASGFAERFIYYERQVRADGGQNSDVQ